MEVEGFKVDEILSIIERCDSHNVSELKLGAFELKFKTGYKENVSLPNFIQHSNLPDSDAKFETPSPVDKELLEDVRLSQLMIDDPFGFEKELLNAEAKRSINEDTEN